MGNVIFKGADSADIRGIIISEQPAIIRPPRREDVVEIDGLDGDVAEFLGYGSYEKTITIGLYGGFDIDQISNFFSGEGWVTFSNEPDKKYWGRISKEINFEQLIRFRTAQVSWTVQPYKKLVAEPTIASNTSPFTVINRGYENSKPVITIYAEGEEVVELDINGQTMLSVVMPSEGYIVIDSEALNCYNANADKNQHVTGQFPELTPGENIISWSGEATRVTVAPNSRFL